MPRRILIAALVLALAVVTAAPVAGAAPAQESAPFCGIDWGSGLKRSAPANSPESPLDDIRVGRHECFDRMVFDMGGPASGYRIEYVAEVRQVATGDVIPLRRGSGARLEIVLKAPADDGSGNPTYDGVSPRRLPRVALADFATFRVAKYGGSFEGRTIVGLGVRARLPFRVTKLGNRIVLDVAHRWNR